MHIVAGTRCKVSECPVRERIPIKYFESLEQNQLLPSCCRHPENHEIEAFYSSEEEAEKGIPDIYIFYCMSVHEDSPHEDKSRWHRRFCCGLGDKRVGWVIR